MTSLSTMIQNPLENEPIHLAILREQSADRSSNVVWSEIDTRFLTNALRELRLVRRSLSDAWLEGISQPHLILGAVSGARAREGATR